MSRAIREPTARFLSLLLACVGLLAACSREPEKPAPGPQQPVVRPARPSIWSELLSPAQVEEALPKLAALGLDLSLAAAKEGWSEEELARVIRAADAQGVRVQLWPLLTIDEGYWACEQNAELFSVHVLHLADFVEAEGLPVDTFEIDVEMSRLRLKELLQSAAEGNALDVLVFLGEGLDPQAFARAQATYRAMVDELHRRGFKANLTTLPQVLDDFGDDDTTVQDLLDVTVSGIDWDRLSFQLYRSSLATDFAALLPPDQTVTADLVYDYAATAHALFGDKAAVDLGLIPSAGSGFSGSDDPTALREDIAAARAAGIAADHLQVFALDGLREQADWQAWVGGIDEIAPVRPEPSAAAQTLRAAFRALDDF